MTVCKSFDPVINKNSKILILGSIPGIKSLEMAEYYAHPKNRFWKVMGFLCNCPNLYDFKYEDKIKILTDNKFALFDVIKYCKREGSLDTNIKQEIPNEIPDLLRKYPNIKKIGFNGNKAYSSFVKHFCENLKNVNFYKLPSTSPANAKFRLEDLVSVWSCMI